MPSLPSKAVLLAGGCQKAKPSKKREQNQKHPSWRGLFKTTNKGPKLGNDKSKRHELMQINHLEEMSYLELQANEEERE